MSNSCNFSSSLKLCQNNNGRKASVFNLASRQSGLISFPSDFLSQCLSSIPTTDITGIIATFQNHVFCLTFVSFNYFLINNEYCFFFPLCYFIFHSVLMQYKYNFEYAFYLKSQINLATIYFLGKKELYMHRNIEEYFYIGRNCWAKPSAFKRC